MEIECHIQASRTVNQAIGRVIRHKNDYGIIILADQRFEYEQNKRGLSHWLRDRVQVDESYRELNSGINTFFKSISDMKLISQAQLIQESSNLSTQYDIPSRVERQPQSLALKEVKELVVKQKVDMRDELSGMLSKAIKPPVIQKVENPEKPKSIDPIQEKQSVSSVEQEFECFSKANIGQLLIQNYSLEIAYNLQQDDDLKTRDTTIRKILGNPFANLHQDKKKREIKAELKESPQKQVILSGGTTQRSLMNFFKK